jgi:hypothetical protein
VRDANFLDSPRKSEYAMSAEGWLKRPVRILSESPSADLRFDSRSHWCDTTHRVCAPTHWGSLTKVMSPSKIAPSAIERAYTGGVGALGFLPFRRVPHLDELVGAGERSRLRRRPNCIDADRCASHCFVATRASLHTNIVHTNIDRQQTYPRAIRHLPDARRQAFGRRCGR